MRSSTPLVLTVAALLLSLGGAAAARAGTTTAAPEPVTGTERLEGIVMDGSGTPASGAIVNLSGNMRRQALTGNGGGFVIEPIAPGVYLLSAAAGSIASEEVRVEIREGEAPPHITLTLRPPLPVERSHGRALEPANLPRIDGLASMPTAGRLEALMAGANLLNDRFETGRTPVVTRGSPRRLTADVRLSRSGLS